MRRLDRPASVTPYVISVAAAALLVPLGLLALEACSKDDGAAASADDADIRPPTPPEWDRAVTRPDDGTAATSRASCTYVRGQMPAETLGPSMPVDKDIPVDTIVVLMQENRSFDSYFGHLGKFAGRTDIESAPDDASNPDADGGAHPWKHAEHLCFSDTDHSWHGSHSEWNDGKNDGFYMTNHHDTPVTDGGPPPSEAPLAGDRALWWYDERDIPFYYSLYSTFATADHYHSALLGPTWPNRMYLYSATSFGRTSNVFPILNDYPYPDKDAIVFDELEKRHVDWEIYTDGAPGAGVVLATQLGTRYGRVPVQSAQSFFDAAKAGTLPAVSFVDAKLTSEGPEGIDEHPPAQIQLGQHFAWSVVDALTKSPQWAHAALFITYDEHGGIYDHVPPPPACAPDDKAPIFGEADKATGGDFTRYGFRVPVVVVSPYAKKGFVSHAVYDHTSITRFIEAKAKIPALTARDANADPFTDMFDWQNPPFVTPPSFPEPAVDQAEVDYCKKAFAK